MCWTMGAPEQQLPPDKRIMESYAVWLHITQVSGTRCQHRHCVTVRTHRKNACSVFFHKRYFSSDPAAIPG